ncbi:MAG TPA: hypothetical protein VFX03_14920, partial [Thermomicrobiales bacterium]|nr:hypothetical protein [Thermomicrobiales bacterium]
DLPADGNRRRFHRLGGGKPLGFGSVSLKIKETALATGADLGRHYAEFDLGSAPQAGDARLSETINGFKSAVAKAYGNGAPFERVAFIADFLTAAEGFSDGHPIHYPRVTSEPSVEGRNFEWFQQNDRAGKAALAPLAQERSLPRL